MYCRITVNSLTRSYKPQSTLTFKIQRMQSDQFHHLYSYLSYFLNNIQLHYHMYHNKWRFVFLIVKFPLLSSNVLAFPSCGANRNTSLFLQSVLITITCESIKSFICRDMSIIHLNRVCSLSWISPCDICVSTSVRYD